MTVEGKYAAAGIEDEWSFELFFLKLQTLVKRRDWSNLAALVNYPLKVCDNGKISYIQNKYEFIKSFKYVFTNKLVDAVLSQKIAGLTADSQGVDIGGGRVKLGIVSGRHGYWIIAVNP